MTAQRVTSAPVERGAVTPPWCRHRARDVSCGVAAGACSAWCSSALWEAAVKVFDWKPYFLPAPSTIWQAFVDNFDARSSGPPQVSGSNALVGLAARHACSAWLMSFVLMRFDCSTTWSARSPSP